MHIFEANYYDGKNAGARQVKVEIRDNGIVLLTDVDITKHYEFSSIKVSPRLGNTPRYLEFPDGSHCETTAHDVIDSVQRKLNQSGFWHVIHYIESHWVLALSSLVVVVIFFWGGIQYGIPFAAKHVAHRLPPTIEERMGTETLQTMDKFWLAESTLSEQDKKRIRNLYADVIAKIPDLNYVELKFRKGELVGANAFALPSGIVVLTDEFIELAKNDQEIVSVLVHELGHVKHRHLMRRLLQSSATAIILAVVIGDVSSVSGLAATLPTVLIESHYSREFETEADDYALRYLVDNKIDTNHFANILTRLTDLALGKTSDEDHGEIREREEKSVSDYFSSHPTTAERIKNIRHYQ